MSRFQLLALLEKQDVACVVALGEDKILAELVELLDACEAGSVTEGVSFWALGRFLSGAEFPSIDRKLLSWALDAPSEYRSSYVVNILSEMWRLNPLLISADRERLDLLLRLRGDGYDEQTEETFLKTLGYLLEENLSPDMESTLVSFLAQLPTRGFASIFVEEAYLVYCAPKLRARGIQLPANYTSFFPLGE